MFMIFQLLYSCVVHWNARVLVYTAVTIFRVNGAQSIDIARGSKGGR